MIRSIIIAASVFAVGAACAQEGPEGRWNTGQGPVTISRDAAGYTLTFEQFPGKATATLKGDKLTGQWWDIAKVQPCETESDGSKHWGGFQVTFYGPPQVDRHVFQGIWTYCQLVPEGDSVVEGSGFSGERAE